MSDEQERNETHRAVAREEPDFVMLYGEFGYYRVTRQTAACIVSQLERRFRPSWIAFEDLFHALVRVRTRDVEGFYDSTSSIRARRRVFERNLEKEEEESDPRERS